MYDRAKEQQKEIATIKERTIYLNLSDADCNGLNAVVMACILRKHF